LHTSKLALSVSIHMKFSKDVELLDVEGVPVTFGAAPSLPYCAAWDVSPPRKFDPASARRNGTPISLSEFQRLVSEFNHPSK
jgi:hypothetical protein